MARFLGDNGRVDDTAVKDVISPYVADRSAVTDCIKLATAGFDCLKAVLIYGFDVGERPLEVVVDAFETLAEAHVDLGPRHEKAFGPLVHPHHSSGRLYGWEVRGMTIA